jgi:hypothetical protein
LPSDRDHSDAATWRRITNAGAQFTNNVALLPIGYPMGRFGPARRVPLADVVYEDRWGQPYRNL